MLYMIAAAIICHPAGRPWRMANAGSAAASVAGGTVAGLGAFVVMMVVMLYAMTVGMMWVLATAVLMASIFF